MPDITFTDRDFRVIDTQQDDPIVITIDYTSLNKACPKDAYPLPSIDCLVDGTAGNKVLSFLDAFSGNNQISMYDRDVGKTAFITEASNYCYQVMPFGLKNGGATY